jgi:hypothetical protein
VRIHWPPRLQPPTAHSYLHRSHAWLDYRFVQVKAAAKQEVLALETRLNEVSEALAVAEATIAAMTEEMAIARAPTPKRALTFAIKVRAFDIQSFLRLNPYCIAHASPIPVQAFPGVKPLLRTTASPKAAKKFSVRSLFCMQSSAVLA